MPLPYVLSRANHYNEERREKKTKTNKQTKTTPDDLNLTESVNKLVAGTAS